MKWTWRLGGDVQVAWILFVVVVGIDIEMRSRQGEEESEVLWNGTDAESCKRTR